MAHPYTEDQLVGQPAIGLFAALGWQTVSAMEETFGAGGSLGRETRGEVVLVGRLRAALGKLNPELPPEAINTAIDELTRDRSGGQKPERVRVIDWASPEQNDFLLVSQLSVVGSLYTCRPDLVGFVNGLPWVVVELKKPGVPARAAFAENLTHYKHEIPQLFWCNALIIASNGTDSRVGSLTADWDRFFEWKRIEREGEPRRVSLEVMLRGTCDRARLLDLAENFTLFSEHKAGLVKVIGQNHQFLGVNNAIASMLEARKLGHGRGGVFWQTQGSGKSFSMVFFAQKVLRRLSGNWTFVVVTDRVELDDQIAKTFKAVGAVSETEGKECHAASGAHLRKLLRGNHRYIFTLIHKFQTAEALTDRADVIVLTDEAHRSQYDTLALNMRAAMPKATFLAFTGTPLIAGEERTKEIFGDYVSIYDFQQSVEDGATVPLFYENRTPELELVNPDLNEDLYRLIEDAGLDDEQEAKLEKALGRQYHLLTRDDRLETVAQDIVRHFLGRGFVGKAMVVSIDKATALRMHDKVRTSWGAEAERVQRELGRADLSSGERATLGRRLEVLTTTEMAVIVSPGQNEIEQMKKLGLDIEPHRRRMNESQPGLDERFKDTQDPLRLVFVCAMWLTGFDAPSCSTVYLDKPMRNHTLMQTIARANRVFPGKHSGVIVDYANVFASLERALAIYGAGKGGTNPVQDKAQLVATLRTSIEAATVFCASHGVDLAALEALPPGGLERLAAVENAMDALIAPEARRRDFFGHEKLVVTLYRAVKPSPAAIEFAQRVAGIATLAAAIRAEINPNPPDISSILGQIAGLLDESIVGLTIREAGPPAIDLSKINFEALAQRFKESKHKNTDLEALKAAIRAKLDKLVRLNRTRADFVEKFEALIESYNAGSRNIDQLLEELLKFSKSLDDEDERHIRENLTREELVIFDILTRPAPELSAAERAEVKKVAREMLARLKGLLVLNWRQKAAARSALRLAIEDTLDSGLPRAYAPEMYRQKCTAVFEHVYESYPERNAGVYAAVA
jgi:type I restriction enzyme, R subunit